MHNELRYQEKTHAISEKLSKEKKKKKFRLLSPKFFFLLKKKIRHKNNKDMLMEKEITSSPSM
jgi:hypothetical protein